MAEHGTMAMLDGIVGIMNTFGTREELAEKLASSIAETVSNAENSVLAVSGGSTPKMMFGKLAQQAIDWPATTITLVDDRCVPADHERSNEKFVRENLMLNGASQARFLPLQNSNETTLKSLMPFDVCILGMGTDGHTASFFPGGNTLAEAVDLTQSQAIIHLQAEGAGEPRITLTLPSIVSAKRLILHIEGDEKRDVLNKAMAAGPPEDLPIRYVLSARPDIEIYWAM